MPVDNGTAVLGGGGMLGIVTGLFVFLRGMRADQNSQALALLTTAVATHKGMYDDLADEMRATKLSHRAEIAELRADRDYDRSKLEACEKRDDDKSAQIRAQNAAIDDMGRKLDRMQRILDARGANDGA